MKQQTPEKKEEPPKLIEGVDFYFENGLMVLTERFLAVRGYCCRNGCRHCPYDSLSGKLSDETLIESATSDKFDR